MAAPETEQTTTMRTLLVATAAFAALVIGAPIGKAHAETTGECIARMDHVSPSDHAVNASFCNSWLVNERQPAPPATHDDALSNCISTASSTTPDVVAVCQARVKMYEDLARAVPQWSQINNSLAFAQWLDQIDPATRQPRRAFLNQAHNLNNTAQVISVFTNFINSSAPAPAPMPSAGGFVVALHDLPGIMNGLYVNASMGDGSVNYQMTLDTGCSGMDISKELADWLIANGHATVLRDDQGSHLAGGSHQITRLLNIDHVTLDGHTAYNIVATDGAANQNPGEMLFGIGALNRFGRYTIDPVGHQVAFR
jgi:hypothetical protein